jgi:hypothetical protein
MTWDEYNKLFHKLELNRVAFRQLFQCSEEVLKLVNAALDAEREQHASMVESMGVEGYGTLAIAAAIRQRRSNDTPKL